LNELIEESHIDSGLILVTEEGGRPIASDNPKALDLTYHYLGKEQIKQPILSYAVHINDITKVKNMRIVESMNELDIIDEGLNEEVESMVLVPFSDLRAFWNEALQKGRVFGPSYRTSENFINCFERFQ